MLPLSAELHLTNRLAFIRSTAINVPPHDPVGNHPVTEVTIDGGMYGFSIGSALRLRRCHNCGATLPIVEKLNAHFEQRPDHGHQHIAPCRALRRKRTAARQLVEIM